MWNKIRRTIRYQICGHMWLKLGGIVFWLVLLSRLALLIWWSRFDFNGGNMSLGVGWWIRFNWLLIFIAVFAIIYYFVRIVWIFKDYKNKNYVKKCNVWYDVWFLFITVFSLLPIYLILCFIFSGIAWNIGLWPFSCIEYPCHCEFLLDLLSLI